MFTDNQHIADDELVLALEAELPPHRERDVEGERPQRVPDRPLVGGVHRRPAGVVRADLDRGRHVGGPAAGQSSVVLSTGLRAGFRSPNRTIATGRYRRSSRLSRSRLDTLPQDRHSDRGRDSSAQAPARNVERERGRIGDIQTLYLARHIDARQTIAGCFRQLS